MQVSNTKGINNQAHNQNFSDNSAPLYNTNQNFQLVPINTPSGICFMSVPTVTSLFDMRGVPLARAPYVMPFMQQVVIPKNLQMVATSNVQNFEQTQLPTISGECVSSLETYRDHTSKNFNENNNS